MSRIEINADGRQVIVDHTGDLPYLLEKALDTWRATEKPRPVRGFAPENKLAGHDPRCTALVCVCLPPSEDRREWQTAHPAFKHKPDCTDAPHVGATCR